MTSRPSTAAPVLAVLAIVLVTLGAHVGGYIWLGNYAESDVGPIRLYKSAWQAQFFQPTASVESLLWQRDIQVGFYLDGAEVLLDK